MRGLISARFKKRRSNSMQKMKEEAENERGNSSGWPESFLGGVGLSEEPLTLTLSPEYRGEGTGTPAEFFSGGFLIFLGFWVRFLFAEQFATIGLPLCDPFLCCGRCGDGIGQMYRSLQTAY